MMTMTTENLSNTAMSYDFGNIKVSIFLLCLFLVQPQQIYGQWNLLSGDESRVLFFAIDMSGSIDPNSYNSIKREVENHIKKKAKGGDHIYFLPVHAHTATADYLHQTTLESSYSGRRRDQDIARKKQDLLKKIDQYLAFEPGNEKNETDILPALDRAIAISNRYEKPLEIVLISDMIQYARRADMDTLANIALERQYSATGFRNKFGIEKPENEVTVRILFPATAHGVIDGENLQLIKDVWQHIFQQQGWELISWDTGL